jgi:hypothetical protein
MTRGRRTYSCVKTSRSGRRLSTRRLLSLLGGIIEKEISTWIEVLESEGGK